MRDHLAPALAALCTGSCALLLAAPAAADPATSPRAEVVVQTAAANDFRPSGSTSADGTLLATYVETDNQVRVWDLRSRKLVRVIGGGGQLDAVALSPDGQRLVGSWGRYLGVYNVADGAYLSPKVARLPQWVRQNANPSLGFLRDGSVVAAEPGLPGLYRYAIGSEAPNGLPLWLAMEPPEGLEVSASGTQALVWGATSTSLVDLEKPAVQLRVDNPLAGNQDWAFVAGGRLVVGASWDRIVVLDAVTLAERKRFPITIGEAYGWPAVARHQRGRWAYAVSRNEHYRIDLEKLEVSRTADVPKEWNRPTALPKGLEVVFPDGTLGAIVGSGWSNGQDTSAALFDPRTREPVARFGGTISQAPDLRFDKAGRLLWLSGLNRSIGVDEGAFTRLVDVGGGRELYRTDGGHRGLSPDGRWVAIEAELHAVDGSVRQKVKFAEGATDTPSTLRSWSPDSRYVAASLSPTPGHMNYNPLLGVWDTVEQRPALVVPLDRAKMGLEASEFRAVFTSQGDRLALSYIDSVNPLPLSIFDLRTGRKLSEQAVGGGKGGRTPGVFSRDGALLLMVEWGGIPAVVVDGRTGEPLKDGPWAGPLGDVPLARLAADFPVELLPETYHPDFLAARSPDGAVLAQANSAGWLGLSDAAGGGLRGLMAHGGRVTTLRFSPDGKRLLTAGLDSVAHLWDVAKLERIATFAIGSEGPVFRPTEELVAVTPDGYYLGQRAGLRSIALRVSARAFPIESYDSVLNRPDIVLERLGGTAKETIAFYRAAWERRLAKLGPGAGKEPLSPLPEVRVQREAVPRRTKARTLRVPFDVVANGAQVVAVQVRDNGVPLFPPEGKPLASGGAGPQAAEVELAAGENRLALSLLDASGRESVDDPILVTLEAPPRPPELYALTVGVSQYQDPSYALQFAAKDARDLAAGLAVGGRVWGKVHTKTVLDGEASREGILAARAFLEQATADDAVLVFFAGHGLLDDSAAYWFATTDLDFANPAARGLPFQAIEGLVGGLKARARLVLLDTCAAGETDEDEVARASGGGGLADGVKVASRGFRRTARSAPANVSLLATRELFASLRHGSGASVIGSSSGVELAFETGGLGNGVFTHALLKLLRASGDLVEQKITVSRLRHTLADEVSRLTHGLQHPVARQINEESDFVVWKLPAPARHRRKK